MRTVTDIIIHCSASPNGKDFHAKDCDSWHVERGFKRSDEWRKAYNPDYKAIGYHYWIPLDGRVETGRHKDEVGAHCQNHNAKSIGICLCGTDKFTPYQWEALATLLEGLKHEYPSAIISGHCEYDTAKAQGKKCPEFDVRSYLADACTPDDNHILKV